MTEPYVNCGKPLDEDSKEFADKLRAVGEVMIDMPIGDCLSVLAVSVGVAIAHLEVSARPQCLLDFFAHVSDEVSTIDDEEEAVGTIN